MNYCVYGPSIGHGSNVQVAAGMVAGLRANGCEVGFIPIDKSEDEWDHSALLAERAIYVGPYPGLQIMYHGNHRSRYVLLAPNSRWLPEAAIKLVQAHAQAVAPSGWAAEVVRANGLSCTTWSHGVDDAFTPAEAPPPTELALAHFSSSVFGRKGTYELVQAFTEGLPLPARLDLYVERSVEFELRSSFQNLEERKIRFLPPPNAGPAEMAKLYTQYSGVIQPSRGEAFGLVPLEARACGRVALMTACTGHAEHAREGGVLLIDEGPDGPLDDGPDSVAPTVSPASIAEAVREYADDRSYFDRLAFGWAVRRQPTWSSLFRTFSWKETTKEWLVQVAP